MASWAVIVQVILCTGTPVHALETVQWRPAQIQSAVNEAYDRYSLVADGELPDYIPALRKTQPELFSIALMTTDGETYTAGSVAHSFAIMSAAKPFTLALVLEQRGAREIVEDIGVEPTGLPFNSVMAIEMHSERSNNPLVNAGAMAAVSLIEGNSRLDKWQTLLGWYRAFANAELELLPAVYDSVRDTGYRNRAIANLLYSYDRLFADPEEVRDVYNRQSSVGVNALQLAAMGATLANGGVQPNTGRRLLAPAHVTRVLSVMMMTGMYDGAGLWAWNVGLPAKSGVGGGIVAIAPGKLAIAAFSPLLDDDGNSVRASLAIRHIARVLNLGVFGPL